MAPQKRYGNRPRNEPLFRLSPFLQSSPAKQTAIVIDDLTEQLNAVHLRSQATTPGGKERLILAPKSINEQSPAQNTRSKSKVPQSAHPNVLTNLLSELAIDEISGQDEAKQTKAQSKQSVILSSTKDAYTESLLSLSCEPTDQPCSFSTWSSSIEQYFDIVKIAEASYGEVYRLVLRKPQSQGSFHASDESVLKILALKPPPAVLGGGKKTKTKAQIIKESAMSAVDNVAAEVKLLQRMADIPGFTNFRDLRVLQGKPSKAFAQAWSDFNHTQPDEGKSQFPDPSKRGSYNKDQLWAVIEMQDAGSDLEHVKLSTVFSVWDVFWGVALALAKGEQEAEFEHRDLHMGNICIKAIGHNKGSAVEDVALSGLDRKYGFTGIETTIIDYTLSRAEAEESVEYLDLATEESIFVGNPEDNYQYDMYRYMRSAVYFDDAFAPYSQEKASRTDRQWSQYHPHTNLLWLHFILHEMLSSPHFSWPSKNMRGSITHACDEKTTVAKRKAKEIELGLKNLSDTLMVKNIPHAGMESVCDLVHVALEKGWLDEADIVGDGDTTLSFLIS